MLMMVWRCFLMKVIQSMARDIYTAFHKINLNLVLYLRNQIKMKSTCGLSNKGRFETWIPMELQ